MDSKKITVAHITYSYLPVTQNWIHNQINQNKSCQSFVICQYIENGLQFPLQSIYPVYTNQNLFTKFWLFLSRLWIWYPKKFYYDVLVKRRPEIIHGHFSHESWRILPIAHQLQIPLVTTFYGIDVNKLPKKRFWRKRYPLLFKYGSAFIVEGHYMKAQLVALGCPQEKIKVVHLGVDIERIDRLICKENRLGVVKILFIGLEREKKGPLDAINTFIKTVQLFSDAQFHIIGDGKYSAAVEKKCTEADIVSKVEFHGFVDVNKYLELLLECDIVFAPSCTASDGDTEGGAPVVLLEAQAAGKPVVSTFHCDIPEVVIDGVTGFLSPEHDIDSLSCNLIKLCRSKELRQKMGMQGRKNAKENHDLSKQVSTLTEIYRSVLHLSQ
jgi:colanic acid/amylovoran biosynthesis glycosyltransferase